MFELRELVDEAHRLAAVVGLAVRRSAGQVWQLGSCCGLLEDFGTEVARLTPQLDVELGDGELRRLTKALLSF